MVERGRGPLTLTLSPSEGEREAVLGAYGTQGGALGIACRICGTPLGVLRVWAYGIVWPRPPLIELKQRVFSSLWLGWLRPGRFGAEGPLSVSLGPCRFRKGALPLQFPCSQLLVGRTGQRGKKSD